MKKHFIKNRHIKVKWVISRAGYSGKIMKKNRHPQHFFADISLKIYKQTQNKEVFLKLMASQLLDIISIEYGISEFLSFLFCHLNSAFCNSLLLSHQIGTFRKGIISNVLDITSNKGVLF